MFGEEQGEGSSQKRSKFESGFYRQERRSSTKVFLILNAGPSDKCVVVRPNHGRRVMTRAYIASRITFGQYTQIDEEEAMVLWDEEFKASDIPFTEGEIYPTFFYNSTLASFFALPAFALPCSYLKYLFLLDYQPGCKGRHQTRIVFAGSIVPVINRMLAGITEGWDDRQQFKVVRVETTSKEQAAETSEDDIDTDSLLSNSSEEIIDLESPIEVGQGVAYEMKNTGIILRGKVLQTGREDGKFVVGFSNGRKLKMKALHVHSARELFAKEVKLLSDVGMSSSAYASSLEMVTQIHQNVRTPILEEGQEETDKYEMLFEVEAVGGKPSTIVGIEFMSRHVMEDDLELWESVLRNLAQKLLAEDVESARQLFHSMELKVAVMNSDENGVVDI